MLALNIAGESYFEGNSAQNGEAFDLYVAVAVTVLSGNIMFKNNSAENGGAIYVYSSPMRVSGSMEYIYNSAAHRGGAIYVAYSTSNFSGNNTFISNSTSQDAGGAVYIEGTTVTLCMTITDSDSETDTVSDGRLNYFEGNSAGTDGGAIVTLANAKLYLCGQSIFKNNTADVHGGAIHIENASAVICGDYELFVYYNNYSTLNSMNHYLQFEENRANDSGGAITAINNAKVSFCGDNIYKFRRNKANFGGAICVLNSALNSTAYMEHENNNATYRGGAVYVNNAKASFSGNNTFFKNHADRYGGAIYVENATVTFCMITELINVLHKSILKRIVQVMMVVLWIHLILQKYTFVMTLLLKTIKLVPVVHSFFRKLNCRVLLQI